MSKVTSGTIIVNGGVGYQRPINAMLVNEIKKLLNIIRELKKNLSSSY